MPLGLLCALVLLFFLVLHMCTCWWCRLAGCGGPSRSPHTSPLSPHLPAASLPACLPACLPPCLLQVVHCRRILKWTYSTAFYSFEEEDGAGKEARERLAQHQEFFEFNQVGGWVVRWSAGCRAGWLDA